MIRFGISEWRQQMFKIIIPILVIALAAFVGMNAKSGLIRGVADGMLVSPARPAVAVKPRRDFAFRRRPARGSFAFGAEQYVQATSVPGRVCPVQP